MILYKSIIDEHFKRYEDMLDLINVKNMELIQLKKNWYSISGTRYDDVKVKGGQTHDIADQLHNIMEKEDELKALIQKKNELRQIHEKEIDIIGDSKKKSILKLFYLDRCTTMQIAGCLHITDGHCRKLKRYAVTEFIEKNISNK